MTEAGLMKDIEPSKFNFVNKRIYTSALSDHDYMGAKKYVVVPIPNINYDCNQNAQDQEIGEAIGDESTETVTAQKNKQKRSKFQCFICGYVTTRKTLKEKHMLEHNGGCYTKDMVTDYKCADCGFMAKNSTGLLVHVKTHFTKREGYKCPDCSFVARNTTGLRIHSKIHMEGTPYKCTECGFSGTDLKHLIKHYAEMKDLKCGLCPFKTHVKDSMVSHRRKHTFERPFSCGICGASFKDRCNMYRHMKTHKNVKLIEISADDLKTKR